MKDRLRAWVRRYIVDVGCPYCDAIGDCHPACVTKKCPECGGLGVVIDLDNPFGVSDDDGVLYGGKPCPRGCEVP